MKFMDKSKKISKLSFLVALIFTLLLGTNPDAFAAEKADSTAQKAVGDLFPEITQMRKELLAAWASLASYNDRIGEIARHQLEIAGYDISAVRETVGKSDVKYLLLKKAATPTQPPKIFLVITGSETIKDAQTNADLHRVVFDGADPFAAFEEAAAAELAKYPKASVHINEPKVHAGFDRYTKDGFFRSTELKKAVGEELAAALKASPKTQLVITGHSLGGAVATLVGARLLNLGVPRDQLEVITFGAPAVGNEMFARYYLSSLNLTRIVMASDQISGLLQSLPNGYVQFGNKKEWPRPRSVDHASHKMITYLDAAIRRYYDMAAAEPVSAPEGAIKVYVAPISFQLDPALQNDRFYIDEALRDGLAHKLPGAVFADDPRQTLAQSLTAAELCGAKYVIAESITGERAKNLKDDMRVSLSEAVYDTSGSLLFYQDVSSSLKNLTALEAAIFNQFSLEDGRLAALNSADQTKGGVPQLRFSL